MALDEQDETDRDWQDEPLGPDDLTIRTPDGTVAVPQSWLAMVYEVLGRPGGYITVASGPPDLYAQAVNHEGQVLLEYRDGAADRHFQATDVSLPDVAAALSQWTDGERRFIGDHLGTTVPVSGPSGRPKRQ